MNANEAEEAAFKEHEAPSWEDDPVARDAAVRWHLRGFQAGVEFGRAGVVAEEPEAARIITTEAEANALPVGSIIRDNMGDVRLKVSDRGWEQSGVVGWRGPTWVAFPAEVLWVPVKQEGATDV